MIAFCDERFVEEDEARVSPFTPAFEFGAGFFTTLKFDSGRFYFLDAHLQRLTVSLERYGRALPALDYEGVLAELMERNGLSRARIKIMVFDQGGKEGVIVRAQELTVSKAPKRLMVYPLRRGNNEIFRHKSMSYFENVYLHEQAVRNGCDDFLYLDWEGRALETSFCNIFLVQGKEIVTPPAALALLPGIVRGELLKRGRINGFRVSEDAARWGELDKYDAAFTTNSIHGVTPVRQISELGFSVAAIEELVKLDV